MPNPPHSSSLENRESVPLPILRRGSEEGGLGVWKDRRQYVEVIGRSAHPKLMLAWIYEAVNKVVAGVDLSLVPYREGDCSHWTSQSHAARR